MTQIYQPHATTEYRNKVTKMTRVMRCVIKDNGKTAQQEDYEVKFFQNQFNKCFQMFTLIANEKLETACANSQNFIKESQ